MKMGRTAEGRGLWGEVVVEKLRMDVDNGEGTLVTTRKGATSSLAEVNRGAGRTVVAKWKRSGAEP